METFWVNVNFKFHCFNVYEATSIVSFGQDLNFFFPKYIHFVSVAVVAVESNELNNEIWRFLYHDFFFIFNGVGIISCMPHSVLIHQASKCLPSFQLYAALAFSLSVSLFPVIVP
uniref:Spastin-like n=1 Tax=Rhizophora mucronata TaxID=61149 RepID=A0A2P2M167_RHIMU